MRCPKDADRYNDINIYRDLYFNSNFTYCNKINPNSTIGWTCTRRKGHHGLHHAHAVPNGICLETWSD